MEDDLYKLARSWTVWEFCKQESSQSYKNLFSQVCSFDSLITFWQAWNHILHADPRNLFNDPNGNFYKLDGKQIDCISVFMEGVSPEWEDERNQHGSDLFIRKQLDFQQLKNIWDRVVFSVIGETLEDEQELVGCRILSRQRQSKIEFWLTYDATLQENQEKFDKFKANVLQLVFHNKVDESDLKITRHADSNE